MVHQGIHDQFVERLVEGARNMVVGHALEAGTQIGPVASNEQLQQNLANIELAKQEGGELLCGGERVDRDTEGYFMNPAIFVGTRNEWQVNREELFAPIACVIKVDSYDEALATASAFFDPISSWTLVKLVTAAWAIPRPTGTEPVKLIALI